MTKINIVVPCFNEEIRLGEFFEKYLDFQKKYNEFLKENDVMLYIVNDGSIDKTINVAKEGIERYKLKAEVFSYKRNKGKGYAVKYGFLNSRPADYYYLCDSDLSSPLSEMIKLYEEIKKGNYDAAIGSRYKSDSKTKRSLKKMYVGFGSRTIINLVLGTKFKDTQCGFKLFSKTALKVFNLQQIDRWGYDFEILYLMNKLKMRVIEVGVEWVDDSDRSRVRKGDHWKTFKELIRVRKNKYNC